MRCVFVDTVYWVAKLNPRDRFHAAAREAEQGLAGVKLITSEMVLVEVLAYFADQGKHLRSHAVRLCMNLRDRNNIEVIPQTSDLFRKALARYESRLDKDWSAVDCASMVIMEERSLSEVLSSDHHFAQAGFRLLLRKEGP